MAQPSIAAFFNTRKRAAADDIANIKNKRLLNTPTTSKNDLNDYSTPTLGDASKTKKHVEMAKLKAASLAAASGGVRTRSRKHAAGISAEAISTAAVPKKGSKVDESIKQKKLVEFIRKGPMSPRKKQSEMIAQPTTTNIEKQAITNVSKEIQKTNEETPSSTQALLSASESAAAILEKTPTKQIIKSGEVTPLRRDDIKRLVKRELNFDEVKNKITRSDKLQELKASLTRIQELEKTRKERAEHNQRLREGAISEKPTNVVQLKQFNTIDIEVLSSPSKIYKTPPKLPPPTPDKNELMSPRHTDVSKRLLFSPAKTGSPSKLIVPPAYQRYMSLAENNKAGQLALPFKYRHLIEVFKAVDSVCAMFHNRHECITFKKLKPAVQRILRKNFCEMHLAQIKQVFPEAYNFAQSKLRNYGSSSKADYYQLVITPNVEQMSEKSVKSTDDSIFAAAQANAMNPQVMTERLQHFKNLLLQHVKLQHDKFLKTLDPPLFIAIQKVTRWHPSFDLENCADVECAQLPQPPNVEKYSSARDILSTARNLFKCATPMERALERYEAKVTAENNLVAKIAATNQSVARTTKEIVTAPPITTSVMPSSTSSKSLTSQDTSSDATASLLKNIPKSLLDKIRAKQAAKAYDAVTRRPSQDREAVKYSRLPELARYLRNVFITERKGVLTLDLVIKKIQNSYRTSLTAQEIEAHLRIIAKELPNWAAFHEVRKSMYVKINKDMNLTEVLQILEALANEKSK